MEIPYMRNAEKAWPTILGLLLAFVLQCGTSVGAATYHIRPDGGTARQCTGLSDAPYPGEGAGLACAWAHPFWALDAEGGWRIRGGDTLIIRNGSYMMGFGAPNSGWCEADGAFECRLPALPSGPSPQQPTRVLGEGAATGCKAVPELWGTQRTYTLINLLRTSNAVIDCLELTDHSGCVEFHSDPAVRCQRDTYPYGDWAATGLEAADSSNVTLRNLNIHGLAEAGVRAGRLTDWTVENVRIAANGLVGWEGDIEDEDSNRGVLHFKRWLVEWNGCAETYPGGQPDSCWGQLAEGYGDGVGTGATGGQWIIEDSTFRYNSSDGLDLLYVSRAPGTPASVRIERSVAYGNAGNQMKTGGPTTIVNSLMVGNCGYFFGKSFATAMGPKDSGDHCRAAGASVMLDLHANAAAYLVNNTIVGEGDVLVSTECEWRPCSGSESLTMSNNVFLGAPDWADPEDITALLWDPEGLASGKIDYNIIHAVKIDRCPVGPHDLCADPLFLNPSFDSFDGHVRPGSPAIDSGLPTGSLNGLVPSDDLEGHRRPPGRGADRGAYERPGSSGAGR